MTIVIIVARTIDRSAIWAFLRGRLRDIPRAPPPPPPALTAARSTDAVSDEYGNPWVTMIIIVRSYLHPNGVAERRADFCDVTKGPCVHPDEIRG